MATARQMVSRVRSLEKLLNSDASITDRVILRELKSKAIKYIKQQVDKRRLWETATIFTNIPCLEMIPVPTSDCCDYISEEMITRSRFQLPKISEGIFGYLVHGVFSVDNGMRLKEITLSRYINLLKLKLPTNDVYYWFYNRYVYTSSSHLRLLNFWGYFEEDLPNEILYPDCKCPNQAVHNPCLNPLDFEFKCPGYLEDIVVQDTLDILMKTYFKVPVDHNSDNKDDQTNKT